jgi:hypothetical protein
VMAIAHMILWVRWAKKEKCGFANTEMAPTCEVIS